MTTEASFLDALVCLIEEVSGIVIPDRDRPGLAAFARRQAGECRRASGNLGRWLRTLRLDRAGEEWRALLSSITVKESYLFRAPQHFEALTGRVVPELLARRPGGRLRLWSAGCARGEEACSIAVALAECELLEDRPWQVLATDVDGTALEQAQQGVFSARAVARVPPVLLVRHFLRARDGTYRLDPLLASRIEYRTQNLISCPLHVPEAPFDVVFLRNVLIYFGPESQRRVVDVVAGTLAPGGFLFLGPAETMWQLGSDLIPVDLGDCFCYQRGEAPPGAGTTAHPARQVQATEAVPSRRSGTEVPRPVCPPDEGCSGMATREQIIDALLTGETKTATRLLDGALRRAPEEPLLRVLQGMARESTGDPTGAVEAYRAALYLNPMLFEVRFLLARCMQHLGWAERARRERRQVMAILDSPRAESLPGGQRLSMPDRDAIRAECGPR